MSKTDLDQIHDGVNDATSLIAINMPYGMNCLKPLKKPHWQGNAAFTGQFWIQSVR
jgi:hypothetical protein